MARDELQQLYLEPGMLVSFYQLDLKRVTWEGTTVEELPLSDKPVGMSLWGIFIIRN